MSGGGVLRLCECEGWRAATPHVRFFHFIVSSTWISVPKNRVGRTVEASRCPSLPSQRLICDIFCGSLTSLYRLFFNREQGRRMGLLVPSHPGPGVRTDWTHWRGFNRNDLHQRYCISVPFKSFHPLQRPKNSKNMTEYWLNAETGWEHCAGSGCCSQPPSSPPTIHHISAAAAAASTAE